MTAKNSPLILQNVTKRFGKSRGIVDVSLELKAGEIFGFLGPNGAGKSTTIRTILDFIQPTSGSVSLLGQTDVRGRCGAHREVGFLAGELALYESMTGRALLRYLTNLGCTTDWKYVDELVERFGAELQKPLHKLSKGNRQKIGIIQALMHRPQLLILDEPTSGLDPLVKEEFYKIMREHAAADATIFMSSHDLAEVQKICDRAGFIREGVLISVESITSRTQLATHRYEINFGKKPTLEKFRELSSVVSAERQSNGNYAFVVRGNVAEFVALAAKFAPVELREHELELEELFMKYYAGEATRDV